MNPLELPTTGELAGQGELVGAAQDVLIVVAHLRCGRHGNMIGAVLHLDRSHRGLSPLLLAELCQAGDIDERWISDATIAGTVSTGARLVEADAIVLDAAQPERRELVDCARHVDTLHVLTVAQMLDAGRCGFDRMRRARGAVGPLRVQCDDVAPRWSPGLVGQMLDERNGLGAS